MQMPHAQPKTQEAPLFTPDGRYVVVRGRLWRTSNPDLDVDERQKWVNDLMRARRDIAAARRGNDPVKLASARAQVNTAKCALGERGPVWWMDGAPDFNRHLARTSPYRDWYETITAHALNDEVDHSGGHGSGKQNEDRDGNFWNKID
jgi:hypothetical protein